MHSANLYFVECVFTNLVLVRMIILFRSEAPFLIYLSFTQSVFIYQRVPVTLNCKLSLYFLSVCLSVFLPNNLICLFACFLFCLLIRSYGQFQIIRYTDWKNCNKLYNDLKFHVYTLKPNFINNVRDKKKGKVIKIFE